MTEHRAKGFDLVRDLGAGTVFDPQAGAARLRDEAAALAGMKARAVPPVAMSAAPAAPARGAMRLVDDLVVMPGGTRRVMGQRWEQADVFDAMCRAARVLHDRRGLDARAFVAPFSPGQIAMARYYRDLVERHGAGGVRCSSMEAGRGGGAGEGGGFSEAFRRDGDNLDALRQRIGAGEALSLRRIRPSMRGCRVVIGVRGLVDAVCLVGQTLTGVLRGHGWSVDGGHREALRGALGDALDRMQGYR